MLTALRDIWGEGDVSKRVFRFWKMLTFDRYSFIRNKIIAVVSPTAFLNTSKQWPKRSFVEKEGGSVTGKETGNERFECRNAIEWMTAGLGNERIRFYLRDPRAAHDTCTRHVEISYIYARVRPLSIHTRAHSRFPHFARRTIDSRNDIDNNNNDDNDVIYMRMYACNKNNHVIYIARAAGHTLARI